jgi:predicted XRE-type DNA-binding protein
MEEPEDEVTVTQGSGNVFADLGLSNPEERLAKADLAIEIERLINARNWTQQQAGSALGLTQPQVSAIIRGRLDRFSTDRLMQVLTGLGQDVEIRIRPAAADQGRVLVAYT